MKKKPSSKRRKAKKADDGDLFGEDEDLPGKSLTTFRYRHLDIY